MLVTVEELKAKFAVRDVAPYGSCIVVPGGEFDPDWEVFLGDQGCKCFFIYLDRKPVTLVRLAKVKSEKEIHRPLLVPPWMNPESRWRPEEDQLIIEFWNKKVKVAEICEKVCSKFPKRTDKAVVNRIHRLVKSGKISTRFARKDKKKPEKIARAGFEPATQPKESPRFVVATPAGRPEPPTPQPASTPTPTPSHTPLSTPAPVINTTLTIQLSVNCNDRNAVANLFDIIEKMGLRKRRLKGGRHA